MSAAAAEKMEPPPSKMAKKEKTTNVVEQNYFKNGESTSNAEDTANIFHDSSNKSVTPLLGGSLPPEKQLTVDYLTELKSLHHKIIMLQDNNELMQQVVEMIAATGRYAITQKTFDFDLCALDRHTVQRLQDFFATLQWRGGLFHVE
jgi:YEATS domain-containing protein 1/3